MISPRRCVEGLRRLKLRTDRRRQLDSPQRPLAKRREALAVVGAGVAGLAAAYELQRIGHEVVVLEAQQRPGGRIRTLRKPFDDGLWAEAGALRIADDHLHTHLWARRLGLTLEPVYPERGRLVLETGAGAWTTEDARWMSGHRFHRALTGRTEAGAQPASATHRLRRLLREGMFQPNWSCITGGMDRLPHALAQSLASRVHYGAVVSGIEQNGSGVRVRYAQGGLERAQRFDRVIMAVPHTILGSIAFDPPLGAAKRQAAEDVPNADAIRFFLQLADAAWLSGGLCGYGATEDGVEFWQPSSNRRTGRCMLVLSAQGAAAEQFTRLGQKHRMRLACQRAGEVFPGTEGKIERAIEVCWREDPWARGAQSRVDQAQIARAELAAQEGRVHFAGEFTANNWMDGALQSAQRVVDEIGAHAGEAFESRSSAPGSRTVVSGG